MEPLPPRLRHRGRIRWRNSIELAESIFSTTKLNRTAVCYSAGMAEMRIVSLLPSATEILFALGLGEQVVGVSHECDYPAEARTKTRVVHSRIPKDISPAEIDRIVREFTERGESIYGVDGEALRRLAPDLIVTQDLCSVC